MAKPSCYVHASKFETAENLQEKSLTDFNFIYAKNAQHLAMQELKLCTCVDFIILHCRSLILILCD